MINFYGFPQFSQKLIIKFVTGHEKKCTFVIHRQRRKRKQGTFFILILYIYLDLYLFFPLLSASPLSRQQQFFQLPDILHNIFCTGRLQFAGLGKAVIHPHTLHAAGFCAQNIIFSVSNH